MLPWGFRLAISKLRMLVGDDSKVVHGLFADIMAKWPKPVTMLGAYDGRQCVTFFEQGHIDIAFIDVTMPEMNGMEAIARLRYRGNRTFITLMSGIGSDVRFQLARYLKTYEFLIKPFLADHVHRILRIHQRVTLPTRAVIVDDSATVRRMVKKILAGSIFNIQVAEASNGDDALAMFSEGSPVTNSAFTFDTVQAPMLADRVGIYGGTGNRAENNLLADTVTASAGIAVSTRFGPVPFSGTTTVAHNTLTRTGGYEPNWGSQLGAIWIYADTADITTPVLVTETYGIDLNAAGSATFSYVAVSGAVSGGLNNLTGYTVVRGAGNSGF